jgi:hypothetical protein
MQVAALEAVLQAMCFLFPNEVKRTAVYQRKKFKRRRTKALEFNLYELIKIAEECAWFPSKYVVWGSKRKTLAGFSHEVRELEFYSPWEVGTGALGHARIHQGGYTMPSGKYLR